VKRACIALGFAALAAQAAVHRDDAGRDVEVPAPPRRIVTLAPNLTEFVDAVGAGQMLVGTVDTSDWPEWARRVPRVGNAQRLDVERILALQPDLVLVWHGGNPERELAPLEAAGVRLFRMDPRRLDDVPRALERIGALLGRARDGAARATALRRELDALRARHAASAAVSVFFQVWPQPLMTVSGRHLTSDLLSLCGARNVFAALPGLAPQVSVESVVAADPEALVTTDDTAGAAPWRRDPAAPDLAAWGAFGRMTAVRRRWLFTVHGDLVTRQGPRIVDGARAVCAALDEVRRERGGPR